MSNVIYLSERQARDGECPVYEIDALTHLATAADATRELPRASTEGLEGAHGMPRTRLAGAALAMLGQRSAPRPNHARFL